MAKKTETIEMNEDKNVIEDLKNSLKKKGKKEG